MNFKVGDVVRIKEWDEMAEEFGFTDTGHINCKFLFTNTMEDFVDRNSSYTIKGTGDFGELIFDRFPFGPLHVRVSEDMVAPIGSGYKIKRVNGFIELVLKREGLDLKDRILASVRNNSAKGLANMINALFAKCILIEGKNARFNIYTGVFLGTDPAVVVNSFNSSDPTLAIDEVPEDSFEARRAAYDNGDILKIEEYDDYSFYRYNNLFLAVVKKNSFSDDFVVNVLDLLNDMLELNVEEKLLNALKDFQVGVVQEIIDGYFVEWKKEEDDRVFGEFIEQLQDELGKTGIARVDRSIETWKSQICEAESRVKTLYEALKEAQKEKAYIKCGYIKTDCEDFIDLLRKDRNSIRKPDINLGNHSVTLNIVQDLLYFSDEDWEIIGKGYIEEECRGCGITNIVKAIFERKCTLIFETRIRIRFDRCACSLATRGYESIEGIPNPHIYGYDCWGDNKLPIEDALRKGDYDTAYCQIKSALSGVNVVDTPVMQQLAKELTDFFNSDIRCIRDNETGELMTIREAENYYKEA